ncbi:beta-ketoacyl synthase N-terminal-like domain-containing protein [Mucilaginibacter sp.]|uniref:beta-ketoacyl-[acyl-carrier-protein] synthase family protein n=1 Tax=Mucilaginibacter sp. TaxID=1882438 RepID=UPI00260444B1|nr:beta-ketoacyl synthase N-terminal-like domain-containing protein [Mucilaginibacter sp.]MDB4919298.1 3-oxoacyl-acyl-carrier-protein synthase [Mucilaginibacter sp.]
MSRMSEPDIFVVADNIFSPFGKTTAENFSQLKNNISGVKQHNDKMLSPTPFFASLFDKDEVFIDEANNYTKFEQLLIASITDALKDNSIDPKNKKTVLIISSTKGNISLLETEVNSTELQKRISMSTSARLVAEHFGFQNQPVVISNACISGVMAIITGMRMLRMGQYENAVICGADVISKFIVSGFQSFQALSNEICRPFDRSRNGLNLGEGAATVILSTNKKFEGNIKVKGGSISNDANHISGPSRTGEELGHAIKQTMTDAKVSANEIDFISAHGTATVYNDEMEANAIGLAGLQSQPLNSLKGYYGHTLGAAGLIESVISIQSLKENLVISTLGFKELGVTSPVNVCTSPMRINAGNFLKTASGFGGCNAALVIGK